MNFFMFPSIIIAFFSCAVSLFTFLHSLHALKAKKRIRQLMIDHADKDDQIRVFMNGLSKLQSGLNDVQEEQARAFVLKMASELSKSDRRIIQSGLQQSSRQGERRFLEDILVA